MSDARGFFEELGHCAGAESGVAFDAFLFGKGIGEQIAHPEIEGMPADVCVGCDAGDAHGGDEALAAVFGGGVGGGEGDDGCGRAAGAEIVEEMMLGGGVEFADEGELQADGDVGVEEGENVEVGDGGGVEDRLASSGRKVRRDHDDDIADEPAGHGFRLAASEREDHPEKLLDRVGGRVIGKTGAEKDSVADGIPLEADRE